MVKKKGVTAIALLLFREKAEQDSSSQIMEFTGRDGFTDAVIAVEQYADTLRSKGWKLTPTRENYYSGKHDSGARLTLFPTRNVYVPGRRPVNAFSIPEQVETVAATYELLTRIAGILVQTEFEASNSPVDWLKSVRAAKAELVHLLALHNIAKELEP